jgi:hypothetical protein
MPRVGGAKESMPQQHGHTFRAAAYPIVKANAIHDDRLTLEIRNSLNSRAGAHGYLLNTFSWPAASSAPNREKA